MTALKKNILIIRKSLLFVFVLLSSITSGLFIYEFKSGLQLETNLQALFPQDKEDLINTQINNQLTQLFGNKLLIAVESDNNVDAEKAAEVLRTAIDKAPFLKRVSLTDSGNLYTAQLKAASESRYQLLTSAQRELLNHENSKELIFSKAQANLFGLNSFNQLLSPIEDPLGFFGEWQSHLQPTLNGEIVNNHLMLSNENHQLALFSLELVGDSFNVDIQDNLYEWLESVKSNLATNNDTKNTRLLTSGIVFHATEAAQNSKSEMNWISAGDLLAGIILFIFTYFRLRPLILTFLSVGFGFFVAFSLTTFWFQKVHVITLVFGTSLIGVAIDYSVHYLCKHQELFQQHDAKNSSSYIIQKLLPALGLGLIASIVGYACLLQPKLPGLQQIAIFSIVGLCASWLFVVVTYPWWMRHALPKPHAIVDRLAFAVWNFWATHSLRGKLIVGLCLACIICFGCYKFNLSEDIRTFYKPSPSLLYSEQEIQKSLQAISPNQYFLLKAKTTEQLLQLEEKFRSSVLDKSVNDGIIKDYSAVTQWVPSKLTQETNYKLLEEKIFSPNGYSREFMQSEGFEASDIQKAEALFKLAKNNFFTIDKWKITARPDQSIFWLGEIDGYFYSIIGLKGLHDGKSLQTQTESFLIQLQSGDSKISLINRINDMSTMLKDITQSAAAMLVLAYLSAAIILMIAYRKWHAALLLTVPFFSTAVALSFLSLMNISINLFHIFGCFLILGLGLDYAIFSYNEGVKDIISQRSIWFSAVTSGVSFGLLGLSSMPMVQSFGVILLMGSCFNLFFAPGVGRLNRSNS